MKNKMSLLCLFSLLICSIAIATTYTFRPLQCNAAYTDANNWLNGQYPGLLVAKADTVVFSLGNTYKVCEIDVTIDIKGVCKIDSGVHFIIRQGVGATIGLYFNEYPSIGNRLTTGPKSLMEIKGSLTIRGCNPIFSGDVLISGELRSDAADPGSDMYGQNVTFNSLLDVKGFLNCKVVRMTCKKMIIATSASFKCQIGRYEESSTITINELTNNGTINLTDNGLTVTQECINTSRIDAAWFHTSGKCINKGTIYLKPYTSATLSQAGELINSGTILVDDPSNKTSILSGSVINTGSISFSGSTQNLTTILFLSGNLVNSNSISITGGKVEITGKIANSGNFTSSGLLSITQGIFNNTGTCNWTVYSYTLKNLIQTSFLNSGTVTNKGLLEVGSKFVNAGVLNIIPW